MGDRILLLLVLLGESAAELVVLLARLLDCHGEVMGTIIACNTTACNPLSVRWFARADLRNTLTTR